MAQGVFRRALVAIVMIATLLLPYSACHAQSRVSGHECCVYHTAPADTVKANCCTVRSELPAVVEERIAPCSDSLSSVISFVPIAEAALSLEVPTSTAAAISSPPPGKFILRI